MNDINIIQSFYSGNCNDWNKFVQSCYFALSSVYSSSSNIPVTLYTDYDFKEILSCAPYKNIVVCLENNYQNIDSLCWAWPKFIVMDMVPRNTIHIDGDVFLKDNSCIELLKFDNYDVVCQCLENRTYCDNLFATYSETFESVKHLNWPKNIIKEIPKCMPNNGVLGIRDEKLWEKYRDTYWEMIDQCTPGSIIPCGWCVPDIIFEQDFLKQICERDGYKIKYIISGDSVEEMNQNAHKKHYQHVCSQKDVNLNKCLKLINKKNKRLYESLMSLWKDKYPQYFE